MLGNVVIEADAGESWIASIHCYNCYLYNYDLTYHQLPHALHDTAKNW